MENQERILSILSRAMSIPLINRVTRRGKMVSFVSSSASSDLLSNRAFSSAKGKLSVTLVSLMVNLDRPITSK
jgi:hypothetical protein